MSHQHLKLETLFKRCDTRGTGYIDQSEFRELCRGFDIDVDDADIIFYDLDHDQDGKISFDDFSFGFRDFVTPGSRRGSIQLGLASPTKKTAPPSILAGGAIAEDRVLVLGEEEARKKQREMQVKHMQAQKAWKSFSDHLDKEDIKKMLSVSSEKIFDLYEDLHSSDAPPHLVSQFEEVISALMADVKKMETETKKMEEKMAKERENHTVHLKNIEAELDAQVAKVENAAIEKAKRDYEQEKRQLQEKMEAEMTQLQSQLKIFQKIDSYLNKEKDESLSKEAQKKLERTISENRALKNSLSDTQTGIAVLRAEMNQIRNQYESKCNELTEERENKMEFVYEFDNLSRQLELLREANQKLQDTNDGLRTVVDVGSIHSPHLSGRHEFAHLISPEILRSASDVELAEKLYHPIKKYNIRKHRGYNNGSHTPSDNGGGSYCGDSDSMRSRCSDRPRMTDAYFGIKRLMDDLDDSGHSTLPVEDFRDDANRSGTPEIDFERHKEAEEDEERSEDGLGISPGETPRPSVKPRISSLKRADKTPRELEDEQIKQQSSPRPVPAPRRPSDTARFTRPCASVVSGRAMSSKASNATLSPRDLEPTGPPDRTYKVVFAGDAAVGKTSFINRITKGVFLSNLSSTLGVDFQVKTILVDDRNIAIQLWDTAGQERFRSVTRSYFRRADGVMLLYDVTSDRSFLSVRQWIDAIDDVSEKRIPIMLCANKVDLRPDASAQGRRCVSTEEGDKMALEHSAIFVETSAKDGSNVIDALVQLSRDMCSSEDVEVQTSALKIRDDGKKKNCCR